MKSAKAHLKGTLRDTLKGDGLVVVGVDLGGTNIQIGVVDADGKIIGRCKRKTKAVDGRVRVIERLCEGVSRALEDAKIPREKLFGVGVGAPSAVDFDNGVVNDVDVADPEQARASEERQQEAGLDQIHPRHRRRHDLGQALPRRAGTNTIKLFI